MVRKKTYSKSHSRYLKHSLVTFFLTSFCLTLGIAENHTWISPDKKHEVLVRDNRAFLIDKSSKNEFALYPFLEKGENPPPYLFSEYAWLESPGWSSDGAFFWFYRNEKDCAPEELYLLKDKTKVIQFNFFLDVCGEIEMGLQKDRGWIFQSDFVNRFANWLDEPTDEERWEFAEKIKKQKFTLSVIDLLSGKKIDIATSVGLPFKPAWDGKSDLLYEEKGRKVRLSINKIESLLMSSPQTINKIEREVELPLTF